MSGKEPTVRGSSSPAEVDAFLRKLATVPAPEDARRGRLVFALDATLSRERTWDQASHIQEAMFVEASRLGGLDVQLVYYRGLHECKASRWLSNADALLAAMRRVQCEGGQTQIGRVLSHVLDETGRRHVAAVAFVGDCMEEDADHLCDLAGRLGVLGVPVFLFHEGDDAEAAATFAALARLSGGACCRFDLSSPQQLRALLGAVASFAAGGRQALTDYSARAGGLALQLTRQIPKG